MRPTYLTDDKLDRLRAGMIAMGQGDSSAMNLLDGYLHMRRALEAIEQVCESAGWFKALHESMADSVVLALRDVGLEDLITTKLHARLVARFRAMVQPTLSDVAEMARRGAEMDSWEDYIQERTAEAVSVEAGE